eukprot:1400659-Pyramimonas_sp.AAC.1
MSGRAGTARQGLHPHLRSWQKRGQRSGRGREARSRRRRGSERRKSGPSSSSSGRAPAPPQPLLPPRLHCPPHFRPFSCPWRSCHRSCPSCASGRVHPQPQ